MAQQTSKLKLTKPELGDAIDPKVFADNFDIIDEKWGDINEKLGDQVTFTVTQTSSGLVLNITTKS